MMMQNSLVRSYTEGFHLPLLDFPLRHFSLWCEVADTFNKNTLANYDGIFRVTASLGIRSTCYLTLYVSAQRGAHLRVPMKEARRAIVSIAWRLRHKHKRLRQYSILDTSPRKYSEETI